MPIKIFFDFHDIFVDARTAWIKSFIFFNNSQSIIDDYINKMSKKDICIKYKLDYEKVEEKYREYLKKNSENILFAQKLARKYDLSICSLSAKSRLEKDMDKFALNSLFKEIYSKNDVVSKKEFLMKFANYNFVIYFTHEVKKIEEYENLVYIPIEYKIDVKILKKYGIMIKNK